MATIIVTINNPSQKLLDRLGEALMELASSVAALETAQITLPDGTRKIWCYIDPCRYSIDGDLYIQEGDKWVKQS